MQYNEKGKLTKFCVLSDYLLIKGRDEDIAMVIGKNGKICARGK